MLPVSSLLDVKLHVRVMSGIPALHGPFVHS